MMAFLSRGHVPDQGRYGKQISKAIDFVLATQKRRGYFCLLPLTPGVSNPNQYPAYLLALRIRLSGSFSRMGRFFGNGLSA